MYLADFFHNYNNNQQITINIRELTAPCPNMSESSYYYEEDDGPNNLGDLSALEMPAQSRNPYSDGALSRPRPNHNGPAAPTTIINPLQQSSHLGGHHQRNASSN